MYSWVVLRELLPRPKLSQSKKMEIHQRRELRFGIQQLPI
jgi:hypothetical protein